jgi:hypothetical protein
VILAFLILITTLKLYNLLDIVWYILNLYLNLLLIKVFLLVSLLSLSSLYIALRYSFFSYILLYLKLIRLNYIKIR